MTAADIAAVKRALNATVLMYFDTTDMAVKAPHGVCAADSANCNTHLPCSSGGPGLCCTTFDCDRFKNAHLCPADEFYTRLGQVFKLSWTINLLGGGANNDTAAEPLCRYYFGPLFCPFQESIDALVPFVSRWVKSVGFDGIYMDEFFPSADIAYPLGLLANRSFDANGDGQPETIADLKAQFSKFKPLLAAGLRWAMGPEAVMLANTVPGLTDPSLNGFTIEMESCSSESGYARCVATLEAQHKVSVSNGLKAMSIMWLTGESIANPAAAQCVRVAKIQQRMPWVMEGTDFYDGSHVICNRTATSHH